MTRERVTVVIPCYKAASTVEEVVLSLADRVAQVIVVDDACPDRSGRTVEGLGLRNVLVIYHDKNRGVGGAVVSGYRKALEMGCDIVVKVDGDGQMDTGYLEEVLRPIRSGEADYTKGNRFMDITRLSSMPRIRLMGNSALSFLVKITSGYWDVMDPTNGFTAIHRTMLERLNLGKLNERYFFETDVLVNLNINSAVVADVPMPAIYGGEKSSLNAGRELLRFSPRLFGKFFRRVFLKYYLYNFNMASVYFLLGLPMFLLSVALGMYHWIGSIVTGETRSAGTIMLVSLPIILSFQMLLQFINIDIMSVPRKTNARSRPNQ